MRIVLIFLFMSSIALADSRVWKDADKIKQAYRKDIKKLLKKKKDIREAVIQDRKAFEKKVRDLKLSDKLKKESEDLMAKSTKLQKKFSTIALTAKHPVETKANYEEFKKIFTDYVNTLSRLKDIELGQIKDKASKAAMLHRDHIKMRESTYHQYYSEIHTKINNFDYSKIQTPGISAHKIGLRHKCAVLKLAHEQRVESNYWSGFYKEDSRLQNEIINLKEEFQSVRRSGNSIMKLNEYAQMYTKYLPKVYKNTEVGLNTELSGLPQDIQDKILNAKAELEARNTKKEEIRAKLQSLQSKQGNLIGVYEKEMRAKKKEFSCDKNTQYISSALNTIKLN